MLNVRIASPPPRMPDVRPASMSSYIFSLKPGDKVTISGPFGEFFAKDTKRDDLHRRRRRHGPLRSHIFDLFRHREDRPQGVVLVRRALPARDVLLEDFRAIEAENPNFKWHVALSEPLPEDNWTGYKGFIHKVVLSNYLKNHPAPGGHRVLHLRPADDELGGDQDARRPRRREENIRFDDFGDSSIV
jgi:Na+-transporting NADH:ubiquinone oxidoreductase subunit F